jgi:pimeloyl-ACP methyl ester carboxylesterase
MLIDTVFRLPHVSLAALVTHKTVDEDKPTLIFLHGFLDNASSFETLLPLITGYQCIAVDFAGHGKSQHRSKDAHYHLSDYAYDIFQLIQTLKLTKFAIVGHSLGAIVGSIYASTQPQGLCGFIAIESCGPLSEEPDTTARQLKACFASRDNANKAIKHPQSIELVIKARCAISDLQPWQAKQILLRNLNSNSEQQLQWRTDKRLRTASPMRMTEAQACAILSSITCKKAVILGANGFDKIKVAIERRNTAFADVPITTFEGGHHVHLDAQSKVSVCVIKYANTFFLV